MWLEIQGFIDLKLAFAGMCGGIARWLGLRESLAQGARSVATAALCGAYLTPALDWALSEAMGRSSGTQGTAVAAFIVGSIGVLIIGYINDFAEAYRKIRIDKIKSKDATDE